MRKKYAYFDFSGFCYRRSGARAARLQQLAAVALAEGEEKMTVITLSRIVTKYAVPSGMPLCSKKYILGEDGKPLEFKSVREAVRFLRSRNLTIEDLCGIDFTIEEKP
jgi:hypothetical protein